MSPQKNKIFYGIVGVLIGSIVFLLLVNMLSKPSNMPLSLKPIDSIQTYFFGFVFSMGNIGWILGSILLIGFLSYFYFIGIWVYKLITKQ